MEGIILTVILVIIVLSFLIVLLMDIFRNEKPNEMSKIGTQSVSNAKKTEREEKGKEKNNKSLHIPFINDGDETEITYPVQIFIHQNNEMKNGKRVYSKYFMTKRKISIGRSEKCDIQIEQPDVGYVQAIIERTKLGDEYCYTLKDVGKTNSMEYLEQEKECYCFMKRNDYIILNNRDSFYIGQTQILIKTPVVGHKLTSEERQVIKANISDYNEEMDMEEEAASKEKAEKRKSGKNCHVMDDETKMYKKNPIKEEYIDYKNLRYHTETMRKVNPDELNVEEIHL